MEIYCGYICTTKGYPLPRHGGGTTEGAWSPCKYGYYCYDINSFFCLFFLGFFSLNNFSKLGLGVYGLASTNPKLVQCMKGHTRGLEDRRRLFPSLESGVVLIHSPHLTYQIPIIHTSLCSHESTYFLSALFLLHLYHPLNLIWALWLPKKE